MGVVVYNFQVCPSCGGRLRSGWPRFGPSAVKCGHCGTIVNTGLPQWANFSSVQKATVIVKELLVPSFFPFRGFDKVFSLMFGLLLISFWIPIPFILMHVNKYIRQSNQYDRTNEPPIWKYGNQRV
jgi:hypothetical protein